MMGKKIAYLDRNEYNYGPAPEIEKVLKTLIRTNYVFTQEFTMKAKRVFYPITSPNYMIFRKNKSFWDMVEKIY